MAPDTGVGETYVKDVGEVASTITDKEMVLLMLLALSLAVTVGVLVPDVAPDSWHVAVYVDPDRDIANVAEQPRVDASTLTVSTLVVASVTVAFRVTVWPLVAADWPAGYVVGLAVTAGLVVSITTVLVAEAAMFPAVSLT